MHSWFTLHIHVYSFWMFLLLYHNHIKVCIQTYLRCFDVFHLQYIYIYRYVNIDPQTYANMIYVYIYIYIYAYMYIYIYRYVRICSPHLCVGFLRLILYPSPAASRSHTLFTQLCHTTHFLYLSFTHNFATHTTQSHTLFDTQLCHTPSFAHNFVTHPLSHNFVTHLFHTKLCHTRSFITHSFVTDHLSHTHTSLSHTLFHTHNFVTDHLSHTTLSYTLFHTPLYQRLSFTQLCHTLSFTHNFVTHHLSHTTALHDIHLHFAWQAWHFTTSTFILRGWSGTYGTGLAPVACFAAALCVSGVALGAFVALGDIVLRGRRGTWRHLPSFCMAGVALHDIQPSGWLRWRAWTPLVAR